MPKLLPFRGLRPDTAVVGRLDDVVCPPYDVITDQQRLALVERSPYNVVRIELPAGDYQQAAALLRQWRSSGALAREPVPVLYGYRMTVPSDAGVDRHTVGVMGALALEPPGRGILPHEHTTPKAKSDRLELIRATDANTSPIWCLCSEPGLTEALGEVPTSGSARAVDDDGNIHEMWTIFDPATHKAVAEIVGAAPLLVADGHHRYETALAYQAERALASGPDEREAAEEGAGPAAILALVVELAEDQLQVLAIHRLVSGLPGGVDVLAAFTSDFELTRASEHGVTLLAQMSRVGAVGIVTPAGSFLARPVTGTAVALELDSSRVDAAVASLPAHQLSYEHDVAEAVEAVRNGRADAAIFCRPATVDQIAATAHGGSRMPPKTTFFWPKPRSGMVLRDW
jgi:uncharacterized protein (DUF1015 family)